MTESCFQAQAERLRKNWGANFYPEERLKIFWQKLGGMPDHWFQSVCTDFIANLRMAPMLKEFLVDAEDFKRREKDRRIYQTDYQDESKREKIPTIDEVHRLVQKVVDHTRKLSAGHAAKKFRRSGKELAAGKDWDDE